MPTGLKNSPVATGLENVSFDPVPKKSNDKECSYNCIQNVSLEKAMAPHFSTLAWQVLWREEPGRLQSMGSLGVGHN